MMRLGAVAVLLVGAGANGQLVNRINGMFERYHHLEDAAVLGNSDIALAGDDTDYFVGIRSAAALTRVGPDGYPIWSREFEVDGEFETGVGVRPLLGGDIAFVFYSGFGTNAVCIARTAGDGTPKWVKRYPGLYGFPYGGMKTETGLDDQFVLFANRYDAENGNEAQLLRVAASTGAVSLDKAYAQQLDESGDVYFIDVASVPGGDYFVTGGMRYYKVSTEQYKTDLLVARINRAGGVVWCNLYDQVHPEYDSFDEGRGIAITGQGKVAVVGHTDAPEGYNGYSAGLHLLLDPDTGAILASNVIDDVDVAIASLDLVSDGNLLASGTRTFGDGEGSAQMWLIDPNDMHAIWRAEYSDGRCYGTDAIEHPAAPARASTNYVLVGANNPFSVDPIGATDQMFIQTDENGNDNCAAYVWNPEPIQPEMTRQEAELVARDLVGSESFDGVVTIALLDSRLLCDQSGCPADLNGDGFVDDADFVIFVYAYNVLDCADPAMPPNCPADFNSDGFVDDADFVIFVAAYNELLCP